MSFEWIKTDKMQLVRKISDTQYDVIETLRFPEGCNNGEDLFKAYFQRIDIKDYSEDEIRKYVSGYYKSLENLRKLYGENSNQIIAEYIAETKAGCGCKLVFAGFEEDLTKYLDMILKGNNPNLKLIKVKHDIKNMFWYSERIGHTFFVADKRTNCIGVEPDEEVYLVVGSQVGIGVIFVEDAEEYENNILFQEA